MNSVPDQDPEDIALDYVLGNIDAGTRRRLEQTMEHDTALAAKVAEWQTRLAPLIEIVPPVAPPASIWQALERQIGRRSIGLIRPRILWASGVGLGIAASFLIASLLQLAHPVSQLTLKAADGTVLATAEIDRRNVMRLHPVAMPPAPPGKSYELWIISSGDNIPKAEGVMPDDPNAAMQLVSAQPGATLAVSIEPAGGSPSGLPTGPVVASGSIMSF